MNNVHELRGLYAIIDPDACGDRAPTDVARAVVRGGCAVLQLRAKRLTGKPLMELASGIAQVCEDAAVPFIINDHVELARTVGARGVHLGQQDETPAQARARLPDGWIGLSTHCLAEALAAAERGADMVGFGPVFHTESKAQAEPTVGTRLLAEVVARLDLPVIAIGGITPANAARVARCGAPLHAAIGAICGADDPERAAEELHRLFSRSATALPGSE